MSVFGTDGEEKKFLSANCGGRPQEPGREDLRDTSPSRCSSVSGFAASRRPTEPGSDSTIKPDLKISEGDDSSSAPVRLPPALPTGVDRV